MYTFRQLLLMVFRAAILEFVLLLLLNSRIAPGVVVCRTRWLATLCLTCSDAFDSTPRARAGLQVGSRKAERRARAGRDIFREAGADTSYRTSRVSRLVYVE